MSEDKLPPVEASDSARLRRRIAELEGQLAAIHGSKMWKLWMWSIRLRSGVARLIHRVIRIPLTTLLFVGRLISGFTRLLVAMLVFLFLLAGTIWRFTSSGLRRLARVHHVPDSDSDSDSRTDRRPRLLIVSPYSIYPLHHGGAARLFNLIRHLSAEVDLYVLVFLQGASSDPVQSEALDGYCEEVLFHHWRPDFTRPLVSLRPPGVRLFSSAAAANRIRDIVRSRGIDVVQLEYTELAQYALPDLGAEVILVEHDIAFRSFWRRRKLRFPERFPDSRFFGATLTDWMRMLRYEVRACRSVDQIHTMSQEDGSYLASYLPDGADRIRVVPNAVDTSYYAADPDLPREEVLFVGNFQNLPNVDALEFFLADIWPRILEHRPATRLTVAGAKMSQEILDLDGENNVEIVGEVPDLRPYYHRHAVLVVPLRAGSGTRLKILEAFASRIPVVSTTLGAEGIACQDRAQLLIADTPPTFAQSVVEILDDPSLARRLSSVAADLAAREYDWQVAAARNVSGVRELATRSTPSPKPAPRIQPSTTRNVDISVIIPTFKGGSLLRLVLDRLSEQKIEERFEILLVDSGSSQEELDDLRRRPGLRLHTIPNEEFNHGLTRDLGASLAGGRILVFLNQDAVPGNNRWLRRLTAPLFAESPPAAVQGGIREFEDEPLTGRFFWDSCGERFYFTSESAAWLERHAGLGFSTVNAALRKDVWQEWPFGWAPIMEDKKWQRQVTEAGLEIQYRPEAAVLHTHDYDLRSLVARCHSEGVGWRFLGERYSLADAFRDMCSPKIYRELCRGILRAEVRSPAELLFPWLRPLTLWLGNRSYKALPY